MTKGNIGKRREAVTGGHAAGGHATGGCGGANPNQKPRSHDTSRIAWAKLMARVGEEFPLECPNCGGDIRLIAFRLFYQCETIPGLRTVGNLRLLRTSCPRSGADPENLHASWRTARSRHRCRPLVARASTGVNSCRSMTIATSFKRRIDELPAIDGHSL
jgi:hypothetical protein